MVQLNEKGYEKMQDNLEYFNAENAQLKALMQVIDDITGSEITQDITELTTRHTLRQLQKRLDKLNSFDDSEIINLLDDAIDRIKTLVQKIQGLQREITQLKKDVGR